MPLDCGRVRPPGGGRRLAWCDTNAEDGLVAFHARFVPGPGGVPDNDSRTLIESCADGWWYTTLLPSSERMIAFLTDKDLARGQMLLSSGGLTAGIARTRYIGALIRSSGYVMSGCPRGANAASGGLNRVAGPGWVAVGDAALTFDPLSSQGIFNAIYTGDAGRPRGGRCTGGSRTVALTAYAARIGDIRRHYRRNLAAAYSAENAGSGHPFSRPAASNWADAQQAHMNSVLDAITALVARAGESWLGIVALTSPIWLVAAVRIRQALQRRGAFRDFAAAHRLQFVGTIPSDARAPYTRIERVRREVLLSNVIEGQWDGLPIHLFDRARGQTPRWTMVLVTVEGRLRRGARPRAPSPQTRRR